MAGTRTVEQLIGETTGAGASLPYGVGHKKLGMWLFILSDSLTFSALLVGYSYVRVASRRTGRRRFISGRRSSWRP